MQIDIVNQYGNVRKENDVHKNKIKNKMMHFLLEYDLQLIVCVKQESPPV
jgi:hypothetical protein